MSHKPWVWVTLIAALLGIVHSAAAESAVFVQGESLDENGDGAITTEEFEAHLLARWAQDDLNDDGKVTQAEWKTKQEQRRAQRFRHADRNVNGVVERGEVSHLSEEMFTRLDTDGSGTLSQVEFDSATKSVSAATMQAGMAGQWLGDEDGDGVITRAEAMNGAQELSIQLDANGDGVLNRGELARGVL